MSHDNASIASPYSPSANVMVTATKSWLKDPANSSLNIALNLRAIPEISRPRSEQIFTPIGRRDPIIVQDVRQTSRGSFVHLITTQDEIDAFDALLEPARTLYLQIRPDNTTTSPLENFYIRVIGSTPISRLIQTRHQPHREMTIEWVEQRKP